MQEFLVNVLVCPITEQKLFLDAEKQILITEDGDFFYRIVDGVYDLLPENRQSIACLE